MTRRDSNAIRVLQSFPHKIGAGRICEIAWHQAAGVADAGGDVLVFPGVVHRELPVNVRARPTLARGRWRVPYKSVGRVRALKLHDRLVARRLPAIADEVDVVHVWPLGALETLRTARRLGIPTILERPNAHTRFAYDVVQAECDRLGVALPSTHEHAYNSAILEHEETEYALADRLLCPSDFVAQTFVDQGFEPERLARHTYGYDVTKFYPSEAPNEQGEGLTVLFVGGCAVRKGVHFALEAWLRSPASSTGRFLIAGEFVPAYRERLSDMLDDPSVHVLGHRSDAAELMRNSDALVLPSLEEGSPLVCLESIGSGCVPLVSEICTEFCVDGENALIHRVGDVGTLSSHITALDADRELLRRLRAGCLRMAPNCTWSRAGVRLLDVYGDTVASGRDHASLDATA